MFSSLILNEWLGPARPICDADCTAHRPSLLRSKREGSSGTRDGTARMTKAELAKYELRKGPDGETRDDGFNHMTSNWSLEGMPIRCRSACYPNGR